MRGQAPNTPGGGASAGGVVAKDRQDAVVIGTVRSRPPSWRANHARRILPCCAKPRPNVRHASRGGGDAGQSG